MIDVRNIRAVSKWRGYVRWVVRRLIDLVLAGMVVAAILLGILIFAAGFLTAALIFGAHR